MQCQILWGFFANSFWVAKKKQLTALGGRLLPIHSGQMVLHPMNKPSVYMDVFQTEGALANFMEMVYFGMAMDQFC